MATIARATPTAVDPDGDGDVDLPTQKARAMFRRLRAKGMGVQQAIALTQKALGVKDRDEVAKASGHAPYAALHPPIRHHGRANWVDKVGGLPGPIDAIARVLISKGWDESRAVATAVSQAKKQCATGTAFGGHAKLKPASRAVICKAVAEWEGKKAAARAS